MCGCDETGSVGASCNQISGQCKCKDNFTGLQCDTCVDGNEGTDCSNKCGCDETGSMGANCS